MLEKARLFYLCLTSYYPFHIDHKNVDFYLFLIYIKNTYFNKHGERKRQTTKIVFERKNVMYFSQLPLYKIREWPFKWNLAVNFIHSSFPRVFFLKLKLPWSWFWLQVPKTIMEMIFNIIIYFTECLSFFIPTTVTETILCRVEMCNYHVSKREGVIFTSDYKGRV